MMPPMTRKASTSTSSAAITSFVLVSMGGRMMHKAVLHGSGVRRGGAMWIKHRGVH